MAKWEWERKVWSRAVATASSLIPPVQQVIDPPADTVLDIELAASTADWSSPVVIRTYRQDESGRLLLEAETLTLGRHGYTPGLMVDAKGRVKTRDLLKTAAVGAAINYARGNGGLHEIGTRTITFNKTQSMPRSVSDDIRDLAQLREMDILTEEEFAAKKAELLARL